MTDGIKVFTLTVSPVLSSLLIILSLGTHYSKSSVSSEPAQIQASWGDCNGIWWFTLSAPRWVEKGWNGGKSKCFYLFIMLKFQKVFPCLWNQWSLVSGDCSPRNFHGAQKCPVQEGVVRAERTRQNSPCCWRGFWGIQFCQIFKLFSRWSLRALRRRFKIGGKSQISVR